MYSAFSRPARLASATTRFITSTGQGAPAVRLAGGVLLPSSGFSSGAGNGVGGFFKLLSRGVQEIQDGHVRRYAMGIAIGTVGILLYVVLWIGR